MAAVTAAWGSAVHPSICTEPRAPAPASLPPVPMRVSGPPALPDEPDLIRRETEIPEDWIAERRKMAPRDAPCPRVATRANPRAGAAQNVDKPCPERFALDVCVAREHPALE